jgi:hypothetical protein
MEARIRWMLVLTLVLFSSCFDTRDAPALLDAPLPDDFRIGVRQIRGVGEFYVTGSGEKFMPRGVNYVFVPHGGALTTDLLRVGVYDAQRTRRDFRRLAELGYNTVRVFIDHASLCSGCITREGWDGLNPEYLDNLADLITAARDAGLVLQLTSNDLPDGGSYAREANSRAGRDFAGYRNSYYLTPEAVSATRRYWRDLLSGLRERGAPLHAVLGWQLLNEQWMFIDQPPLSVETGLVTSSTGTYDMSVESEKWRMVDEGLRYYSSSMREEILRHDPDALVTMGFFVPRLIVPGWYLNTRPLLEESDLDYFDFHAYPGSFSMDEHLEAFGMRGYKEKPIVLGEYGPFRHIYPELIPAARETAKWAAEAAEAGFDGFLYWSYYPDNAGVGDRTWGFTDEDGYIMELLAPIYQPDIAVIPQLSGGNLAYGTRVRASASAPGDPPSGAVDENAGSVWNSGGDAPQWIRLNLDGPHRISEIRLLVAQDPAGYSEHELYAIVNGSETLLHRFAGNSADGDMLRFSPSSPVEGVTSLRIVTVASPSWVAWREIEVFGEAE